MFPAVLRAPALPTPAWVSSLASRLPSAAGSCVLFRQLAYLSQHWLPYLQPGNETELNLPGVGQRGSEVCT